MIAKISALPNWVKIWTLIIIGIWSLGTAFRYRDAKVAHLDAAACYMIFIISMSYLLKILSII